MTTVYRVVEWDDHFENFKSRSVERCGYVCVPNKQHGEGLTHILSLPDGLSVYGVFNLILGACSQHAKPRQGWLTNDGRSDGKPWSIKSLATRWRQSDKAISRAIEVLCCADVGWIISMEYPPGIPAVSGKGMEGNGKEGNKDSPEPDVPAPVPVAILSFPIVGGGLKAWPFTAECRTELSSAFPDLDVLAESRKALAWVQSNPGRRKTAKGMKKYLFGWMDRAQNGFGKRKGAPVGAGIKQDWGNDAT
jgi:hypothetical protein